MTGPAALWMATAALAQALYVAAPAAGAESPGALLTCKAPTPICVGLECGLRTTILIDDADPAWRFPGDVYRAGCDSCKCIRQPLWMAWPGAEFSLLDKPRDRSLAGHGPEKKMSAEKKLRRTQQRVLSALWPRPDTNCEGKPCSPTNPRCPNTFRVKGGSIPPCDLHLLLELLAWFHDLMKDHGILYWLSHGSLLGATREEDHIDHETDLDVQVRLAELGRVMMVVRNAIQDSDVPYQLRTFDERHLVLSVSSGNALHMDVWTVDMMVDPHAQTARVSQATLNLAPIGGPAAAATAAADTDEPDEPDEPNEPVSRWEWAGFQHLHPHLHVNHGATGGGNVPAITKFVEFFRQDPDDATGAQSGPATSIVSKGDGRLQARFACSGPLYIALGKHHWNLPARSEADVVFEHRRRGGFFQHWQYGTCRPGKPFVAHVNVTAHEHVHIAVRAATPDWKIRAVVEFKAPPPELTLAGVRVRPAGGKRFGSGRFDLALPASWFFPLQLCHYGVLTVVCPAQRHLVNQINYGPTYTIPKFCSARCDHLEVQAAWEQKMGLVAAPGRQIQG